MVGLQSVVNAEDLQKSYKNHLENWHMCIEWANEFGRLAQAVTLCSGGDRQYIPPLGLPVARFGIGLGGLTTAVCWGSCPQTSSGN
eukprot:784397-Rhodomonas_salina.1